MADPTRYPHTGTPRWAKVAGAIALILVVLLAVVLLTGRGGSHGPERHTGPPPGVAHP